MAAQLLLRAPDEFQHLRQLADFGEQCRQGRLSRRRLAVAPRDQEQLGARVA